MKRGRPCRGSSSENRVRHDPREWRQRENPVRTVSHVPDRTPIGRQIAEASASAKPAGVAEPTEAGVTRQRTVNEYSLSTMWPGGRPAGRGTKW